MRRKQSVLRNKESEKERRQFLLSVVVTLCASLLRVHGFDSEVTQGRWKGVSYGFSL